MRIRGAGCGWPSTLSFPKIISARCGSLYGQLPSHKGHLLWKIRDANYLIDNKAGIIVDAEGTRANRADEISSPKPWSTASRRRLRFGTRYSALFQALTERGQEVWIRARHPRVEESDDRHRRLLRARRERPRRRAAEQRDELAPDHSITSSAATSSPAGTSKPSNLAVLRLSVVSYLVGACTGRSAGAVPRRMRST